MVGWVVLEKFSMHDIKIKGYIYGFFFDTSFASLHKTNLNNWTSVNIERIEFAIEIIEQLHYIIYRSFVIYNFWKMLLSFQVISGFLHALWILTRIIKRKINTIEGKMHRLLSIVFILIVSYFRCTQK